MSSLQNFISLNTRLSGKCDKLFPQRYSTDGNYWFQQNILHLALSQGETVYDLGGGARPWVSAEQKSKLDLHITGLDISLDELKLAPEGSYDEIVATDLCSYEGNASADVVICQATLEHVPDNNGSIRAIASVLKPGGKAYIFAPCRNALFALVNRLLPQETKIRILNRLFPYTTDGHDGFEAPYDNCFPSRLEKIARENGMSVIRKETFWTSGYFKIFFPAYLFWRIYQSIARLLIGDDACETFILVLQKD